MVQVLNVSFCRMPKSSKIVLVAERVTRNLGFGHPQYHGKMDFTQVQQGFSSFFDNFFIAYLIIFQMGAHPRRCGTLKYQQILAKNEEKAFFHLRLQPIFRLILD